MNDDDVAEAEVVEDGPCPTTADVTGGELVHVEQTALTRTAAPLADIRSAFTDHVELVAAILDPKTDYESIKGKQFPKKAALRKLATAYGVSCEVLSKEHYRDGQGRILSSEFVVRATAPNGRVMDGWGSCSMWDKCEKASCKKDDHDPRSHFSHPDHDIPATAETRAKNRAFADLFAMGQVSAEEVRDITEWESLDWPSETGYRALMVPLVAGMQAADDETRAAFKEWRREQQIGWPIHRDHAPAVRQWMQAHNVVAPDESEFGADENRPVAGEGPTSAKSEPGTDATHSRASSAAPPPTGEDRSGGGEPVSPARPGSPPAASAPPDTSGKPTKQQLARLAILCNEIAGTTANTADLTNDDYRHALVYASTDGRVASASAGTKREIAWAIDVAQKIQRGELRLDVTGDVEQLAELVAV